MTTRIARAPGPVCTRFAMAGTDDSVLSSQRAFTAKSWYSIDPDDR